MLFPRLYAIMDCLTITHLNFLVHFVPPIYPLSIHVSRAHSIRSPASAVGWEHAAKYPPL